jgi:hypothetical protein
MTDWLLALASTVILGSESRGTDAHILLSHDSGSRATVSGNNVSKFGVLYHFNAPSQHLPGGSEENYKTPESGWPT